MRWNVLSRIHTLFWTTVHVLFAIDFPAQVCMCEPGGYDADQKELRSDVDANWKSDGVYDDAAAYATVGS